MTGYKRVPPEWPWWVRLSLGGSKSRAALLRWAGLSLVFGALVVAFGLWSNLAWSTGVGLIGGPFAALMYWLAIRWIDQRGAWDKIK